MIKSFRHRGLMRLHHKGERHSIGATFIDRVEDACTPSAQVGLF